MYDPNSAYTQGSYRQAVADPGTAPSDDPVVCLQVNASWIPYIIGSCLQLAQPTSWISGSPSLADLLGRVQDLLALFGTAEACVAPQFRLTSGCGLQYSLDGGTTWLDFTDWAANFPACVQAAQAYVQMTSGLDHPPIPEWNADGTDWLYGGAAGTPEIASARYPWAPRLAPSWYGSDETLPTGWTVPGDWSAIFGPPSNLIRLTVPGDSTKRFAVAPVSGITAAVLRCRSAGVAGISGSNGIGFGTAGDGSDFTGVTIAPDDWHWTAFVNGSAVGATDDTSGNVLPSYWTWIFIHLDGTNLRVDQSVDGETWDTVFLVAATMAPTYLYLVTNQLAQADAAAYTWWIDFLALGATAPAGV